MRYRALGWGWCDNGLLSCSDKKKKQYITLVEEDIAKLKYEVSYLREQQNKQKLTLNRVIKLFRAIDIMNFQVSGIELATLAHTGVTLT